MASAEVIAQRFAAFRKRELNRAVREAMDRVGARGVKRIKRRFFRSGGATSPNYIVSRTGRLERSVRWIRAKRRGRGTTIIGSFRMGNVRIPYAHAMEFGVTFIHPGNVGKLQVFEIAGQTIFTRRTRPHLITIAPRAPLGRGAALIEQELLRDVDKAIERAARRVIG